MRNRPPPRRALLEPARLAAVESLRVDARAAAALDRIAEAAAASADAAHAAVALVGGALHYVGEAGMRAFGLSSRLPGGRTMPRMGSLCEEVVGLEAPLLIEDAASMAAFSEHALVRARGVRSYAGVPVVVAEGYAVGTVCLLSPEAAQFDTSMFNDLSALAAMAARVLGEGTAWEAMEEAREAAPIAVQGWLGVKTARADRDDKRTTGLIVLRVARGSPAALAGLRPADLLQWVDGVALRRPEDLRSVLAGRAAGSSVSVRYQRRGQTLACRAVLTG